MNKTPKSSSAPAKQPGARHHTSAPPTVKTNPSQPGASGISIKPAATSNQRRSLHLHPEEWAALDRLALEHRAMFRGIPSWRNLVRRIARGSVMLKTEN